MKYISYNNETKEHLVCEKVDSDIKIIKKMRHFHEALKFLENNPSKKGFETWTPKFIFDKAIIKFAA